MTGLVMVHRTLNIAAGAGLPACGCRASLAALPSAQRLPCRDHAAALSRAALSRAGLAPVPCRAGDVRLVSCRTLPRPAPPIGKGGTSAAPPPRLGAGAGKG
jgi:hypothetical protein